MKNLTLLFVLSFFVVGNFILASQDILLENEINYFSKFIKLPDPRGDIPYGVNTEAYILQEKIVPLIAQVYQTATDKVTAHHLLQHIFATCEKQGKTEIIKLVCQGINSTILGKNVKLSSITFMDIRNVLTKKNEGIYRGMEYSDLFEIYPLIDYPYLTVRSEYGIGDYLFGIADSYQPGDTRENSQITFDGVVVMKAGDTHWQKFATIDVGYATFYNSNYPRAIGIKNGKLNLLVLDKNPEKQTLTNALGYNFELQNEGIRKLTQCLAYVFPEWFTNQYVSYDDFLKTKIDSSGYGEDILLSVKQLSLSSCNGNITIKTNVENTNFPLEID